MVQRTSRREVGARIFCRVLQSVKRCAGFRGSLARLRKNCINVKAVLGMEQTTAKVANARFERWDDAWADTSP
jgi:hypothetical protein